MKWNKPFLRDCLVVLVVVTALGGLFGAFLGWSANRFGLSSSLRLLLLFAYVALVARVSGVYLQRRSRARGAEQR